MTGKIIRENTGRLRPGQDLVVAGYAGLEGTRILVRARRKELEQWFSPGYLDRIESREDAAKEKNLEYWGHMGATEAEPAGEGGILTAIWNLTGAYRLGARFSLRQIPVQQGTIEVCERFDLNPYRLYSRGCWLLAAENSGQLTERLDGEGIAARVIGQVTDGIARLVVGDGETGYLNRPQPDELEQILPGCREVYI